MSRSCCPQSKEFSPAAGTALQVRRGLEKLTKELENVLVDSVLVRLN